MNGPFLLTMIWVVPFITALACLSIRTDDHRSIKVISLTGTLINFLLVTIHRRRQSVNCLARQTVLADTLMFIW
ncbi:MAG: hypothetical protein D3903_06885, partial [Candidatus Electrothrix sp. GM3_4]|nr:hypothetical protein [Candidatus Electrothrix sp. GM3_4]